MITFQLSKCLASLPAVHGDCAIGDRVGKGR